MNESLREKKILDDLVNGKPIVVNNKRYELTKESSRKLLHIIRSLSENTIEPPIGQDKVSKLIEVTEKILNHNDGVLDSVGLLGIPASRPFKDLWLSRLSAYNFRGLQNFSSVEFTYAFRKQPYLITGVNGAGKTSLLNAIIWCLTGQLLWDRSMPSAPEPVELKIGAPDSSDLKTIKNKWPIQVSIPSADEISTTKPHCWVELELVGEGDYRVIVRREIKNGTETVTGMDFFDPLSIELALLMPGRVNHIEVKNNTQLGDLFYQISGLDTLNKYGTFTSNSGINRALSTYENQIKKQLQVIKLNMSNEVKVFNDNLPFDLIEDYKKVGVNENDEIKRAASRIEWLEKVQVSRLKNLQSLFKIPEDLSDSELISLGKNILVAYENLKEASPSNWSEVQALRRAIEAWNSESELIWNSTQDEIKSTLQLAIDWYVKEKEITNLRLKIAAAQLVSKNQDLSSCPLCGKKLEDDHPLRHELIHLNRNDQIALKSVGENLNLLTLKLEKSLPDSIKRLSSSSIKEIIRRGFENNIGRLLKGSLESIRDVGIKTVNDLLEFEAPNDEELSYPSRLKQVLKDESAVLEQFEAFEKKLDEFNKKVLLVSWASKNLNKIVTELEGAFGYGKKSEASMIGKLELANNIASSVKPIQTCIDQLKKVLVLYQEKKKTERTIEVVDWIKSACEELTHLSTLANNLLNEDLKNVETELYENYVKLYGDKDFVIRKILPTKSGRKTAISFWVEFKKLLVEAGGVLNASRIRALLWAYVFSLAKMGRNSAKGDWISFMVIDEPLTSLDQEHQRNFAQLVFDADNPKQIIIASHDLRWPRELSRLSKSLNIYANYITCYGIARHRETIRLSDWISNLELKWKKWEDDKTDIEIGRDYVAAAREWCEEELKDILVWASEPSQVGDTLGKLLGKLDKAYSKDQLYNFSNVKLLSDAINLILPDLQNSHHGSSGRNRILGNEITKVHATMEKVANHVGAVRDTLFHRMGIISIV